MKDIFGRLRSQFIAPISRPLFIIQLFEPDILSLHIELSCNTRFWKLTFGVCLSREPTFQTIQGLLGDGSFRLDAVNHSEH